MTKTIAVAKALVVDADGNILLMRRSQTHPTRAGKVDLPGGIIEPGESPDVAVKREIEEETSIRFESSKLQIIYAGTEKYKDENRVRVLYLAKLSAKKPTISISWEHEWADWVSTSELQKIETEFHSFYREALRYIRENNLLH